MNKNDEFARVLLEINGAEHTEQYPCESDWLIVWLFDILLNFVSLHTAVRADIAKQPYACPNPNKKNTTRIMTNIHPLFVVQHLQMYIPTFCNDLESGKCHYILHMCTQNLRPFILHDFNREEMSKKLGRVLLLRMGRLHECRYASEEPERSGIGNDYA
jgi:hypothetical protein